MSDLVALFCTACAGGPIVGYWCYHKWRLYRLEKFARENWPSTYEQKQSPPQSVSGIIPWHEAPLDRNKSHVLDMPGGGQSNSALLVLMKRCEEMVEQRQPPVDYEEIQFAPADWPPRE